jgi:hypothetical protein
MKVIIHDKKENEDMGLGSVFCGSCGVRHWIVEIEVVEE